MTIPTETCVSGFIVSMGALEQTAKGVHYVRARVGVNAPTNSRDAGQPQGARTYFFLYVYGDAAERVSRRFRRGDVFIASGRVGYAQPTGSVFIAEHIGHDAKRTTYRVVRTRHRNARAQGDIEDHEHASSGGPATNTVVPAVPAPAGVI